MAFHTIILVIAAILAMPLLMIYRSQCRRTNAAHLQVLRASYARQTVDLLPWKNLEKQLTLAKRGNAINSMISK